MRLVTEDDLKARELGFASTEDYNTWLKERKLYQAMPDVGWSVLTRKIIQLEAVVSELQQRVQMVEAR